MVLAAAVGRFDPFVHTLVDDPYPIYRGLREEQPVYHNVDRGCWVVSRYQDIQTVARDVSTYSNAWGDDFDLPPGYLGPGSFLDIDPPDHTRLRRIVRDTLGPRAIDAMAPTIRLRARSLVDRFTESGEGDLAADIAFPLPMLTILGLLGFPEEDGPQLREWLDATALRTPGSSARPPECDQAHEELATYVERLLAARRAQPRDDLLTVMAGAVDAGLMTSEETRGMSLLVITAGWETTAALISNCLLHLGRDPVQRASLAADPTGIPAAVEEVLRFDAPVQYVMRTATREARLGDATIPELDKVLLLWASANRDERVWDDPDRFDIRRDPRRHLAFGEGIHHCIGAPLARLEAQIVLEEILARAPEYALGEPISRLEAHVLRGLSHLPATATQRS